MADWAILFEGKYDGHALKVSMLDSFILTELYSNDSANLVINVIYVGYAKGDLESFAETLPKDNLLYLIHGSNRTDKFFCLTVPSVAIPNNKVEMDREITKQIQVLAKTKKVVFDIAETYDIDLKDLHESGKDAQAAFFINPLNVFKAMQKPTGLQKISDVKLNFGHMLTLGKHKASEELASEEIDAFRKTIIFGKKENQKGLIFDITEEFSLGAIPVVVFDFEKSYLGLKQANPDAELVKQFNSNSEPTGFPIESLYYDGTSNSNLWVDLSSVSLESFAELFGLFKEYKEIFKRAKDNNPASIDELIGYISKVGPDEQIKEYDLYLAKRMAHTLKLTYPNLFKGKISLDGVDKVISNKIGKITLLTITGNNIEKYLISQNIIKSFGTKENIAFVIPSAGFFCPKSLNLIQNDICNYLLSFNGYFVLSANSISDLNDALIKYKSIQIDVISETDVALKVGNASPYRLLLRPSVSNNGN